MLANFAEARVAIVHGAVPPDAPPDEQDVLHEVEVVAAALRTLGMQPKSFALELNLVDTLEQLRAFAPAFVFNLVESLAGKGHLISLGPALFELAQLRYTGAPLTAIFTTSNKLLTKQLLRAHDIPTPPWWQTKLPTGVVVGPWIVKSVWEHASIGLDDDSILPDGPAALPVLQQRGKQFGGEWFAERFIPGREFNVGLLEQANGVNILPIAEICFDDFPADKPQIVGYRAKWDTESFEYGHTVRRFVTASSDALLLETLRTWALSCWTVFGLRGYARVDFRVDEVGRPWILEINANPCLSPDAGFAVAAQQAGLSYTDMIGAIVDAATK